MRRRLAYGTLVPLCAMSRQWAHIQIAEQKPCLGASTSPEAREDRPPSSLRRSRDVSRHRAVLRNRRRRCGRRGIPPPPSPWPQPGSGSRNGKGRRGRRRIVHAKRPELTGKVLSEARVHGLIGKGLPFDEDSAFTYGSEIRNPDIGPFCP